MATFVTNAYATAQHITLSPDRLLAWSGAVIQSVSAGSVRLNVRDSTPGNQMPNDYDLVLAGTFTFTNGVLSGGTVTRIDGIHLLGGAVLSQLSDLTISLASLIVPGPPVTLVSPVANNVLGYADVYSGGVYGDNIMGYNGADIINGFDDDDTLSGGGHADTIDGGDGADVLRGGHGVDSLSGGAGQDRFEYAGNDLLGGEVIDGGGELDRIVIDAGAAVDLRIATLTSIEELQIGSGGNATIHYTTFDGTMLNHIFGGGGVQTLTITYNTPMSQPGSFDASGLVFSSWTGDDVVVILGHAGEDTLTGTAQDDSITGNYSADEVIGGLGDDTLSGGNASNDTIGDLSNDTLNGGAGADLLYGNSGADWFIYASPGDIAAGEAIDGGSNPDITTGQSDGDAISVTSAGIYDFQPVAISNVETIRLASLTADTTVVFGSADFSILRGSTTASAVMNLQFIVQEAFLSDLQFYNWDSNDIIILLGASANGMNTLIGTNADDTIIGRFGADRIAGERGADTLLGGGGDDRFYFEAHSVPLFGDYFSVVAGESIDGGDQTDTIHISKSQTGAGVLDNDFRLATITGIEQVDFSNTDPDIAGTGSATFSSTQIGAGLIQTFIGDDAPTIVNGDPVGGSGVAILNLVGSSINLSQAAMSHWDANDDINITGTTGSDTLRGSVNREDVLGLEGDDLVRLGVGELAAGEYLDGGLNVDTLELLDGGSYNFTSSVVLNFERIRVSGEGIIQLILSQTAANHANIFEGNSVGADEAINLQVSGNQVDLGSGSVFTNWTANDTVRISGTAGGDTLYGSPTADSMTGDKGGDDLRGNDGNDTIDGGQDADTMWGGLGDDLFFVDATGDTITEMAQGGVDTVRSLVSFTLASEVDHLVLLGTAALNGTGNAIANTLTGNDAVNNLTGGAADDTLIGGGSGDYLTGGTGADSLVGGTGDDYYYLDEAGDITVEQSAGGYDRVIATATVTLGSNIERLILDGTGGIGGTGNAEDNSILGNSAGNAINGGGGDDLIEGVEGADTLDGGLGFDTIYGGQGDDDYTINETNDRVIEYAGQGFDEVFAAVNFTLYDHVEKLTLTGTGNINGGGGQTANTLLGNSGNNSLDGSGDNDSLVGNDGLDVLIGGTGIDTMEGGAQDDTYYVDSTADVVTELGGGGFDRVVATATYVLSANVERLILSNADNYNGTGNAEINTIVGNAGINIIDGLLGNDTLTGGAGIDSFTFSTALGPANVDQITDFITGTDRLRLDDAVFAGIGAPGALGAGRFFAGTAAGDPDDRIIYNAATGQLFFDADGNGTGVQVQFARLFSNTALAHADIFVV